jgi:hypothetical protein
MLRGYAALIAWFTLMKEAGAASYFFCADVCRNCSCEPTTAIVRVVQVAISRAAAMLGDGCSSGGGLTVWQVHPWLAIGVAASTAATDAVYVMFSAAVASRRRVPAATWSSVWYLLSAFAVISYTRNWVYVCFAAIGSWIGAYVSMTVLRRPGGGDLERGGPKASL